MLEARTTYVSSTEGVEVAVHDFGGEGPTLLLCHATGFCAHTLMNPWLCAGASGNSTIDRYMRYLETQIRERLRP